MDEQFALLAIQSSLKHTRALYEMLLIDKMLGNDSYRNTVGHNDILSAIEKISERMNEIEKEIEDA